jgi:hypothetical protein
MKLAAYMAFSFVTFFHILLVPYFIIICTCIWLYVLYASVQFCKLCIFIVCLCVLVVMFMYFYCCVCSVLCILFHCVVLCTVCV